MALGAALTCMCNALKNFYSYKKRYSVTNTGFSGYKKTCLWAAVDAPGSTLVKHYNIL